MKRHAGVQLEADLWIGERAHSAQPAVGLILDAATTAEKSLEEDARRHPTYADVRHRLGLLRLLRGDPEAAEHEFEEALGINPGYRAAHFGLRFARLSAGRPLGKAPAPDPRLPQVAEERWWRIVDQAYELQAAGQDPATALATGEGHTGQLLRHHYSGYFAWRAGHRPQAREQFAAATSLSQVSAEVLTGLGLTPDGPGADGEEQAFERVLWSPVAEDLYTYMGRICARNGMSQMAIDCYRRAYLVLPREAEHDMYRAQIATAAGGEQQALALLQQAVAADPTSVQARIALGYENASQGFLEEARREFQVATSLAPGYADVRYNLGLLFVGEGRIEEALEEFRRALSLNPAYLPARHSMSHLLCRAGRYAEGLQEYGRLLKQGFQSSDMLVQMAKAALGLDRVAEALEYLERAIFLNPDFAPTYYYIGQAYQRRGLKNKARSAWRTYLEKVNDWEPMSGPVPDLEPPEPSL